ncbi:transcriptional regulatory [Fusarium beomiforme]|uniref:Transcriptional regulatory n=1 Tax=Fusarium beomiforme TaxID=44412 RepID=A0A9P5DNH1_9HYPO|nr:transcriptional regulatory [Fusarium beomiforme]
MTSPSSAANTQFYGPLPVEARSPDAQDLIPNSASRSMAHVICTPDAELGEPALTQGLSEKTLSGRDLSATQEVFFLDLFWDSWHCCYQLLDEVEFKAHYASLWNQAIGDTRKDSPLVDIVLALCMQFGVTSIPRQSGRKAEVNNRDAPVAGRWLYQRCQRLISGDLERPTLETFQCQLWSAIYLGNASYQNMAQSMLGVATRTAYTLGLHIEIQGSDLPFKEREARKRAWCILVMAETRSCIRLGRPWVTQTQQIAPFLPTGGPMIPSGGVAHLSYTKERAKLTEIARTAFDVAVNGRSKAVANMANSRSQVANYATGMERIRDWAEALPKTLKTDRRGDGKPLSTDLSEIEIEVFAPIWLRRQRLMLELFYHELMLTLGRNCISQSLTHAGGTFSPSPETSNVIEVSVLHAAATTQLLYQVYQEYDILNGWYEPLNCQWNAAITLVGYLLTTKTDSTVGSIAQSALSQSITVLERMGEFFGTAASAASVIRTLQQKLNTRVQVQATNENNVTAGGLGDINFSGWENDDMSFEGILGTFGTESELDILGLGIDLEPFA